MAKRLRKEEQIMPDIRILTEGDSSVLVEFGKEISPEINRKITAVFYVPAFLFFIYICHISLSHLHICASPF